MKKICVSISVLLRAIVFTVTAIVLIGAAVVVSANPARSETLKFGVFDLQKVMSDSQNVKNYRKRYQDTLDEKKKPFVQKEEEARILREKIDQGKFPPQERMAKEDEFAQRIKELRRLKEDLDSDVAQMDRWLKGQVFKDLDAILKDLARKEGYTIIFEKNTAGIAYYNASIDVTDKILSLYNKK
ncbi:MAG: OmpH family outer membrane protein [Nitrospirae bacterium]|nr:OmpH family outer membrane protein [Nitrospirota bacterium]